MATAAQQNPELRTTYSLQGFLRNVKGNGADTSIVTSS
jgi:hypothetical protein